MVMLVFICKQVGDYEKILRASVFIFLGFL
jgi:hypothetical protein